LDDAILDGEVIAAAETDQPQFYGASFGADYSLKEGREELLSRRG
jgi:hypothetical protein